MAPVGAEKKLGLRFRRAAVAVPAEGARARACDAGGRRCFFLRLSRHRKRSVLGFFGGVNVGFCLGFLLRGDDDGGGRARKGKEAGKAQQGMDAGQYMRYIPEQMDPNPQIGIIVSEVIENEWFKKGYQPPSFETLDVNLDDVDTIFSGSGDFANLVVGRREGGPAIMNAFELLSTSQHLNLGTRFEKQMDTVKREMRFASRLPADEMLSKIEQAATLWDSM